MRYIAITILLLSLPIIAQAQTIRVNDAVVENNQTLNLYGDDLKESKIVFVITPDEKTTGIDLSVDNGRTWMKMESSNNDFLYQYRPLFNEDMFIQCIIKTENGMRTYTPGIKIIYHKQRPDNEIITLLDKMQMFYQNKNQYAFIDLFSSNFPNRGRFIESIQNDFYSYTNIRLRYRVDRKLFSADLKSAIWDVYWDRKYTTRSGTNGSDSASISMRIVNENNQWKIAGFNNNTLFGTALSGTIDLTIASTDITPTMITGTHNASVRAVIHNTGTGAATDVVVKYYYIPFAGGLNLFDTKTLASIAGGSSVTMPEAIHTTAAGGPYTYRIIIDPDNQIGELDETNNQADKTYTVL